MAKRLFDIFAASIAIVLMSPIIALLALIILFGMGRPVLFRQTRAGLGGADFTLTKFRTMRSAFEADGKPLPDDQRVTAIGRFLRRSRLDELPELWLIVRGAMSFVGPRPLPRGLLEERGVLVARSRVRPGLTGLAQVSGNTLLTNSEKFAIDLYYVDHRSMLRDLGLIASTIWTVIAGERRDEPLIRKALQLAERVDRRSR